ncbi:hypothetical protein HD806DRAFT_527296 [Xylariaceae sp. AK1471]|nr:hypothetical protein HD806DRAFT_527296 [Xylariaceae sp. AK1471]
MSTNTPRCNCSRNQSHSRPKSNGQKPNGLRSAIRGLLTGSHSSGPKVEATSQCRACKTASNRHGMVFNDPLRCHVPFVSTDVDNACRVEINRFIWGDMGCEDEDVIVNRVISTLTLENSPILEFLEGKGSCDLSELPADMRRNLERVIGEHIQQL